jgi:hypothetical protein
MTMARRVWVVLMAAILAACVGALPTSPPTDAPPTDAPPSSAPTAPPSGGPTAEVTQPPTEAPTPSPTDVARLTARSQVGCAIARALAGSGPPESLAELADCRDPVATFTAIPEGGLVATDANGEAWIDTDDCGRIFLFHDSRLRASPCREDSPDTGAFCLEENSAAWQNECSGVVSIVTPTGAVSLQGTWLSVTYDPARQVTLVCVFEGTAIATPFREVDGDQAASRAIVGAGSFWYTAPDDQLDQIGGVEPRAEHGFEELPAVMNELGLQSWFASIGSRAQADRMPLGDFPVSPALNLRAGGGLLESVAVQDAVLASTDWERWWFELFPDGDRQLVALIGTDAPRDLRFSAADPVEAATLLKRAGAAGLRPTILVERDERLLTLAEVLAGNLKELGVAVAGVASFDFAEEAASGYSALLAEGRPVIWFSSR